MKKSIVLITFIGFMVVLGYAQVPNKMNYQTVIHNETGELIVNQNVDVRVSIVGDVNSTAIYYIETHSVNTNDYGILNIRIGDGDPDFGSFEHIIWSESEKYVKIEIDLGTGYVDVGTIQLLSVPYAMYSNKSDSSRVSDFTPYSYFTDSADVANFAYKSDTAYFTERSEESDSSRVSSFTSYSYFSDSARVAALSHNSKLADFANNASSANTLSRGVYSTDTDTLFVVKDHDGNVVFAVFPDGAQVIVNETTKGKVGGFAVSGRNPAKATDVEILRITPDSTRIYVNDTVSSKGKVGGFAVSGRNPAKRTGAEIFFVTSDSTRVYINEDTGAKGKIGGFAVSGRNPAKGALTSYMQVTPDSTRIFVKDTVAGFGVASIDGASAQSLLNLNKQNYFIGHQTGNNTTIGKYNSMIGYQAGYTNKSGSNNIFFGYKAGYLNVTGGNNVFIGTESGYNNQYTFQSTYVGYRSGYELVGASNTVMGSMAGENADGGNNTFIGTSAGRIATGGNNTFIGAGAGYGFPDENQGTRNTYIGQAVGSKTTTGSYNVMLGFNAGYLNYDGSRNTFLGYDAGRNIHQGSGNVFIGHEAGKSIDGINDRLIIENSDLDSTSALIYGDFNKNHLRINANVGINYNGLSSYGLIVDGGSSSNYSIYAFKGGYTPGSWFGASDARLKKDIQIIQNPLYIIKSIKGVSFNWRVNEHPEMKLSSEHQIGVIAQDVEKVLPELVSEDDKGFKAVAYDKLSAVLIEAIKEQQNQIDDLKSENEELKQKLNEIIKMLEEK